MTLLAQQTKFPLALETRKKTAIDNLLSNEPVFPQMHAERAGYVNKYSPSCIFRGVGPSMTYNCHGMTFAARRTQIFEGSEVLKILQDDNYGPVNKENVLPGDIAVYFSTASSQTGIAGDPEHSATVIEASTLGGLRRIKVVSRWRYCDEVIHFVENAPYDTGDVRYYRVQS